jgi:hypothetical protein
MCCSEKLNSTLIVQSKTLKAFFTTEAKRTQRKDFIVSFACGAANNKS